LVVLFPIGWVIGELKNKQTLRRISAVGAFVFALLVGVIVGYLQQLRYNAEYGFASKQLFEQTVISLKKGESDKVIEVYETLTESYRPTYENKADFDELVEKASEELIEK